MPAPCSPEEINRMASLITDKKSGETQADVIPFSLDIPAVASDAEVASRSAMGWFNSVRTQRGAFGDKMSAMAVDPLQNELVKVNNKWARETDEMLGALEGVSKGFGPFKHVPYEKRLEVAQALRRTNMEGKYTGPPAAFTPEVIAAAEKLRPQWNRLGKEFGIDGDLFLNYYLPLIEKRPSGIFYEPPMNTPLENDFRRLLRPEDIKFYNEIERKGMIMNPEPDLFNMFHTYLRGGINAKIMKPFVEKLEKDVVNPHYEVGWITTADGSKVIHAKDGVGYGLWKELVHNVFGGPTPLDKNMTQTLKGIVEMTGKTADTRSLYAISNTLKHAYYAGALASPVGGRPSSIIRQIGQIVPTYAEHGPYYTAKGIQRTFEKGGVTDLIKRDILSSPIEHLSENIGMLGTTGRAINKTVEMGVKLFSATDQIQRAIVAHASAARFEDTLARGGRAALEKMPMMRKEFRQEFVQMIRRGDEEGAKYRYMMENIKNLQYDFGKANRPQMFRGALGNLMSVFTGYPLNTFEMVRMFSKRALPEKWGGEGDPRPIIRLMLTTYALGYAGSEYLNADVRSAFVTGAIPHSLAFPKMGLDGFMAANSTVDWLTGSLFNVGETKYQNMTRWQNYSNFGKDLSMLVPGRLFFFQDIPKALDTGSMARMFALTPKAKELDIEAKTRAAQARHEKAGSGFGRIGSFGGGASSFGGGFGRD